jgi:hypothetical protein
METPTPNKRGRKPGSTVVIHSPTTIAKAKLLYLYEAKNKEAIGKQLRVSPETVASWIRIHGWASLKEQASAAITAESDKQLRDRFIQDNLDQIGVKSASLASKSLDLAEQHINDGDSKSLMYAASSAKTLADLARSTSSTQQSSLISLTVNLDSLPSAPKNIAPIPRALPCST